MTATITWMADVTTTRSMEGKVTTLFLAGLAATRSTAKRAMTASSQACRKQVAIRTQPTSSTPAKGTTSSTATLAPTLSWAAKGTTDYLGWPEMIRSMLVMAMILSMLGQEAIEWLADGAVMQSTVAHQRAVAAQLATRTSSLVTQRMVPLQERLRMRQIRSMAT